jgi:hypothetical protein
MASPAGNARDPTPAAAYRAAPPAAPAGNPVPAGQVWAARLQAAPADGGSVPRSISIRRSRRPLRRRFAFAGLQMPPAPSDTEGRRYQPGHGSPPLSDPVFLDEVYPLG